MDIRNFFSGNSTKSAKISTAKKPTKRGKNVIESDEESEEPMKQNIIPETIKKQKITNAIEQVDPKSFFNNSQKIKQSDKSQVKKVIAVKKPSAIVIDDDDDLVLLQEVEKTELLLSSAKSVQSSPVQSENLSTDSNIPETASPGIPISLKRPLKDAKLKSPAKTIKSPSSNKNMAKKPKLASEPINLQKEIVKTHSEEALKPDIKKDISKLEKIEPAVVQVDAPKKKFNYHQHKAKAMSGPKFPGSKEIPQGEENCLAGLSFVFTGELSSISREEASDLVKRYGGRVLTAPSSKTSYVVLGEDPGQSKLDKIKQHKLKSLDEDSFLSLIGSSKSIPEKKEPVPTQSKGKAPEKILAIKNETVTQIKKVTDSATEDMLWTDKYKPKSYSEVIGNKGILDKLSKWLREWNHNRLSGFPKHGKDSTSEFRAVLLSGPPGLGKTTMAHLVAKIEGFDAIEFNASDVRSKKALDDLVQDALSTRSITEFFGAESKSLKVSKKSVIIMDEVDGMSGGDRGGNAELIKLIKKTKVPIICICNDRKAPKIRSLSNSCLDLTFRRPTAQQIEMRIKMIASREGLELKPNVIAELVMSTSADIRQILNLLSTYRLSKQTLTFDQSKGLAEIAKKNITVGPFDVVQKLFNQASFRNSSFADKIECYFQDYSLIPLMIQENYITMTPSLAKEVGNNPKNVEIETMNLLSKAADSISCGDLMDSVQRQANSWSLLPVHAVFSTVHPCFFTHGYKSGMYNFPSWLGQNSKQLKNKRLLREMGNHLHLHITGDCNELRQYYIPTLVDRLVRELSEKGQDGIDSVISLMDSYHLTKDDFDFLTEVYLSKLPAIPTSVKSAFTRKYNQMSHPTLLLPSAKSKGSSSEKKEIPDFEGIMEDEDSVDVEEVEDEDDSEKKEALLMMKKPKPKSKASSSKPQKKAKTKSTA